MAYLLSSYSRETLCSVGQEDLRNLHCELHPVSYKWYCLGVQLYVPIGTLKCIESDCAKVSDCLLEMLTTWVKSTNPPPTWEALAKALESSCGGEDPGPAAEGQVLPRRRGSDTTHPPHPRTILPWCSSHLTR